MKSAFFSLTESNTYMFAIFQVPANHFFFKYSQIQIQCDNDLHQQKNIFHNHMTILHNQQDTSAGYKQDTKLLKLNVLKRMGAVRS